MKKLVIAVPLIVTISIVCLAQAQKPVLTFDQLFPRSKQRIMGLHKLIPKEKEALRSHVERLLTLVLTEKSRKGLGGGKVYAGVGGGLWIKKNVDSGTYIILEDNSLWKIDPLDKIDAMLWLPISEITVIESTSGSPGYNYLLINTDDGEKAHAKYMGKQ